METEVSVVTVTPEMAQKWLVENTYEHQRNIRPHKAKYLAEEMQRGTFKQDTVLEFSTANGSEWLTDGQHRLSALLIAKTPQRFVVVKRHLKDEDAVAVDYTRTDNVLVRSIGDAYKTLRLENEFGSSASQIKSLGQAVALINQNFNKPRILPIHPEDRLRMMREYNESHQAYTESVAGSRRDIRHKLDRSATVGVAIVTFRYSAQVYGLSKVESFWHDMAMDDGLRAADPRKAAIRHLTETGMFGGATAGKSALRVSSSAYSARYLAICFNAHVTGKELKFARPDTTKPIVILGSPFTEK